MSGKAVQSDLDAVADATIASRAGAGSTAAAPVAAPATSTDTDGVEQDAGQADTRDVSRTEQRRIDIRTRQIVQDRESRAAAGDVTDEQITRQVAVLDQT